VGVYGSGGLLQLALNAVGVEFHVLAQPGSTVLLIVGAPVIAALARLDRRPLSEYGLAIADNWARQFWFGLLAGIASCAAYLALLWITGALLAPERSLPPTLWPTPLWVLATSIPAGGFLALLFCGFVQGTLRRLFGSSRVGGMAAAVLTAVLFGVLVRPAAPWQMLALENRPRLLGLLLAALFLCMLRLIEGSIVLPAALLAGYSFVERTNTTMGLLRRPGDQTLLGLLAPDMEPLRSPVVWGVLSAALLVCANLLFRQGEASLDGRVRAPEGLRRLCPFVMFSIGAPLDVWLARLIQARFRVPPRFWPRLIFTLIGSSVATAVCLPERLLLPPLLRRRRVPGPVFVLGAHRSGTTHLHNLLSLDPQFIAPRMFQVINPTGYLVCGWAVALPAAAFMPWRRPQDSMELSFWSAQEEEFAVANSCGLSPYWALCFPRHLQFYWGMSYPERLSRPQLDEWAAHYRRFLQKLTLFSPRRPVLKNPCNTTRVALLREMFPDARFIHVYRHPYAVYLSNLHMKRTFHEWVQLQELPDDSEYGAWFLSHYVEAIQRFYRDAAACPRARLAEVRFEDLETGTIDEVRRLYRRLELPWPDDHEVRLKVYLQRVSGHRKNRFAELPDEQRQKVRQELKPLFERWGYSEQQPEA
jgi:hypothetical protein